MLSCFCTISLHLRIYELDPSIGCFTDELRGKILSILPPPPQLTQIIRTEPGLEQILSYQHLPTSMLGTAPQLLMLRPHRLKRKTLYSSIHHHENLVCLTVLNESTIQNAFVIPPYSLASKLLMLKAQGNGNVDSIRFFLLPFLFYSSLWFTTSAPRNSCGRHRQGSRPALCFAEFSDTAGSHKNLHFVARLGELVTFGEFPPAASVNISPNIFLLLTILAPQ